MKCVFQFKMEEMSSLDDLLSNMSVVKADVQCYNVQNDEGISGITMSTIMVMFQNVILFAALMMPGFLLGKTDQFERASVTTITNILMCVGMPFLVFSKLLEMDVYTLAISELLCCIGLAVGVVLVLIVVCKYICPEKEIYREFSFCSAFSNCGFIGIPLAAAVFPEQPKVAVFVSLFNVFTSFMLWTFGVYVLTGDKKNISIKKAIYNPVTAAIILGTVFSLVGCEKQLSFICNYSSMLAGITTPISMIVIGYEFSNIRFKEVFTRKSSYLVSLVKLVICPFITTVILMTLGTFIEFGDAFKEAMFIATAVPTAATASAMAEKYGADGKLSAEYTVVDTALSVLSLPLMYMIFHIMV